MPPTLSDFIVTSLVLFGSHSCSALRIGMLLLNLLKLDDTESMSPPSRVEETKVTVMGAASCQPFNVLFSALESTQ